MEYKPQTKSESGATCLTHAICISLLFKAFYFSDLYSQGESSYGGVPEAANEETPLALYDTSTNHHGDIRVQLVRLQLQHELSDECVADITSLIQTCFACSSVW